MNEAKKEKLKKALNESGLLAPGDSCLDVVESNYYRALLGPLAGRWLAGKAYFTQEKFIWQGWGDDIVIPYSQIRQMEKGFAVIWPIAVKITYQDDKLCTKKFSIMGRQKWLDLLSDKAKVPCP